MTNDAIKVCHGCGVLVLAKVSTCPICNAYRFATTPEEVDRQIRLLKLRDKWLGIIGNLSKQIHDLQRFKGDSEEVIFFDIMPQLAQKQIDHYRERLKVAELNLETVLCELL